MKNYKGSRKATDREWMLSCPSGGTPGVMDNQTEKAEGLSSFLRQLVSSPGTTADRFAWLLRLLFLCVCKRMHTHMCMHLCVCVCVCVSVSVCVCACLMQNRTNPWSGGS